MELVMVFVVQRNCHYEAAQGAGDSPASHRQKSGGQLARQVVTSRH